ncbi:MAG: hypothetical protein H6891_04745 [Brucellaceae bacterium]|nr:hypothetical protein [Brucellaceae bacterium]
MKRKVTVRGTAKDDVFDSLKDGDVVAGGKGSDTYEYKLGDGSVRIHEPNDHKSTDTLVLSDLDMDDVSLFRQGNTLKLLVHETGDVITIAGQFSKAHGVEQITFADGRRSTCPALPGWPQKTQASASTRPRGSCAATPATTCWSPMKASPRLPATRAPTPMWSTPMPAMS